MNAAISKLGISTNEEWIHLQWPVYGSELWVNVDVSVRSELYTERERDMIRMLESGGVYDKSGSERRNDSNESNKLHDKRSIADENIANNDVCDYVYGELQYGLRKCSTREPNEYEAVQ